MSENAPGTTARAQSRQPAAHTHTDFVRERESVRKRERESESGSESEVRECVRECVSVSEREASQSE